MLAPGASRVNGIAPPDLLQVIGGQLVIHPVVETREDLAQDRQSTSLAGARFGKGLRACRAGQ